MKLGRLPKGHAAAAVGRGNVANAVLAGLLDGLFEDLLGFTEVLQDGMLELIKRGKMAAASAHRHIPPPRGAGLHRQH